MRLFFISLVIALACLYPEIRELMDWEKHAALSWLGIPYVGLSYMVVFFHELGHTVFMWSFGQAAVPMFNFEDGGGFAHPLMDRSILLQGIIYMTALLSAMWLFKNEMYIECGVFAVLLAVHFFFSFGERYNLVIGYMGNGGAVVMGCYCVLRARLNWTYSDHSPHAERYTNMIFGLFAVLQQVVLCTSLIYHPIARDIYEQGIGGHIANDYTVIAQQLGTRLKNVAWFSLGFTACCTLATLAACFMIEPKQERNF